MEIYEKGEKNKNTIVLTNKNIEELMGSGALLRLMDCRELSPKQTFDLSKLLKRFDAAAKTYQEVKRKLAMKHALVESDGKTPLVDEQGRIKFPTGGAQRFEKDLEEIINEETELSCSKPEMYLDKLPTGVLSAGDMVHLECLVSFVETTNK